MSKETCGPAFPVDCIVVRDEKGHLHGSEISSAGMTIRDYFAASALQGILSAGIGVNVGPSHTEEMEGFAKTIYMVADAMIAAREE